MKKFVGGRGEDVGGRLDIGEQLIPLLLLCPSYDWAAWPFPSVFLFSLFYIIYMTQLLQLGKFEYGGGPIFKVVLEC